MLKDIWFHVLLFCELDDLLKLHWVVRLPPDVDNRFRSQRWTPTQQQRLLELLTGRRRTPYWSEEWVETLTFPPMVHYHMKPTFLDACEWKVKVAIMECFGCCPDRFSWEELNSSTWLQQEVRGLEICGNSVHPLQPYYPSIRRWIIFNSPLYFVPTKVWPNIEELVLRVNNPVTVSLRLFPAVKGLFLEGPITFTDWEVVSSHLVTLEFGKDVTIPPPTVTFPRLTDVQIVHTSLPPLECFHRLPSLTYLTMDSHFDPTWFILPSLMYLYVQPFTGDTLDLEQWCRSFPTLSSIQVVWWAVSFQTLTIPPPPLHIEVEVNTMCPFSPTTSRPFQRTTTAGGWKWTFSK